MTTFRSGQTRAISLNKGNASSLTEAEYLGAGGPADKAHWAVAAAPSKTGSVAVTYINGESIGTQIQLTISIDNAPKAVQVTIVA
jgi:hypothetical protein